MRSAFNCLDTQSSTPYMNRLHYFDLLNRLLCLTLLYYIQNYHLFIHQQKANSDRQTFLKQTPHQE